MKRGTAYGALVAIIIIVLLSTISIYKIQQTYVKGTESLENYKKAVEKPVITVDWVQTTTDKITVRLTNQGPTPVTLKKIYLYRQENDGTPVSVVPAGTTDTYLPVGSSLEVDFIVNNIVDYVFWNKPVRILMETDRGLVLASFKNLVGRAYVNIHLPTWVQTSTDASNILSNLKLEVETPSNGQVATETIPLQQAVTNTCPQLQDFRVNETAPFGSYVCHDGTLSNVVVMLTLPSNIQYTFRLKGDIRIPAIKQSIQNEGEAAGFTFTMRKIDFVSKATVPPEGSAQLTFFMPDATWVNEEYKPHSAPQNGYTLDFSWLFKPRGDSYGDTGVSGGGLTYHDEDVWKALYRVASRVLGTGTVTAYSPSGCQVYPPPTIHGDPPMPPGDVVDMIKRAIDTVWGGYTSHAGVPIVVYSPSGSCPNYGGTGTREILQVIVNMKMNQGHFMVIPVFTWEDDDGSNSMPVDISINVKKNGYPQVGVHPVTVHEDESRGPTEFAVPIDAGTFQQDDLLTLTLHVTASRLSSPVVGMLVLSKLIIVPVINPTQACIFQPSSDLSFPWDIANLTSGKTEGNDDYLYFLLNPYIPYDGDVTDLYSRARFSNELEASVGSITSVSLDYGHTRDSVLHGINHLGDSFRLIIGQRGAGDGSLRGAFGVLGVYQTVYDTYTTPTPSYAYEYSIALSLHGHGYPIAVAGIYSPTLSSSAKHVVATLTMRMPSRGSYVAIIPYRFISSAGSYLVEPRVSASVSYTNLRSGEGDNAGLIVVHASGGSTVRVVFDLGLPPSSTSIQTGPVTVGLGIGGVVVIRDPSTILGHAPASDGKSPPYGILVAGVEKIDSAQNVYAYIFDRETGLEISKGGILLSEGDNVISFRQLDWYRNAEFYTYPIHSLYILIENAKCPSSG